MGDIEKTEEQTSNEKEPLNMPKGSVRAIIAILLVVGCIVGYLLGKEIPTYLITSTSIVVVFYFGTRTFLK